MSTKSFFARPAVRFVAFVIIALAAFFTWRYVSTNNADSANTGAPNKGAAAPAGSAGKGGQQAGGRRFAPMSPVQAATATLRDVPDYLSGLGTVIAANTVTVRSQVSGQLMALHFTEGQQVNAGDLLAEIDPRPYQVQLTQSQGQLATAQATLANARRDLARYQSLAKTNVVSRQQLDTQSALVSQSEGSVKTAQGAVASAQLQLTYSKVTAPVSGRVGLKQVDIGNMVSTSDTNGIIVITQTHPIDVLFTLPESDISRIYASQKQNTKLQVEAWDRNNKLLISTGELLSLDNLIDTTTGTIKLKARFTNQDDALFPNQFVNARIKIETLKDAVVVPTAAIQMGTEGKFVWLLDAEDKVSKHIIETGIQDSQQVVVLKGVSANQRVVTDGIDRLTEGLKVEVVDPHSVASDAPAGEKKPAGERKRRPDSQRKA